MHGETITGIFFPCAQASAEGDDAWAMKGWHQIFFHDPEGNVIEVHQIMSE